MGTIRGCDEGVTRGAQKSWMGILAESGSRFRGVVPLEIRHKEAVDSDFDIPNSLPNLNEAE